jgi:hypothetical protein
MFFAGSFEELIGNAPAIQAAGDGLRTSRRGRALIVQQQRAVLGAYLVTIQRLVRLWPRDWSALHWPHWPGRAAA